MIYECPGPEDCTGWYENNAATHRCPECKKRDRKAREAGILDEAERVLGNLILEIGFDDNAEEYKAWQQFARLLDKKGRLKKGKV